MPKTATFATGLDLISTLKALPFTLMRRGPLAMASPPPMTVASKNHDPPLTPPATAPRSLPGGSLLVSALAQFSLPADTLKGQEPLLLWLEGVAAGGKDDELMTMTTPASEPEGLCRKENLSFRSP